MARKTLTTDSDIRHDGSAETFLMRQAESLRHWAAPQLEAARAWGEYGAAAGGVGAAVAGEEGRRLAKDVKKDVVPAVTAGLGAVTPVVAKGVDAVQDFLAQLQEQAQEAGEEFRKEAASARKDAEKTAKKAKKVGAKKAKGLRKDGRKAAKKAGRKADAFGGFLADKAQDAKQDAAKGGLGVAGLLAAAVTAVQDQGAKLAPQVQDRLADAARYAEQRRDEFAPVAAARLADVAGSARQTAHDVQVPSAVEQALISLTGDKKIVDRLRKGAEDYAGQTEKDLKRAAKQSSRSGGRGWIVAGMALAAAGAGYAVWKLTKPVQDPWAAPTPGPITANIPVVQPAVGNPYAKQEQAVAEANAQVLGGGADSAVRTQQHVTPVRTETVIRPEDIATPGTGRA